MIFITSDLHFNHEKDFLYAPRGFENAKQMNEAIIENINSVVQPEDDLYVLGDLMLGGPERLHEGLKLISSLNGKLHIVRGNHDSDLRWSQYRNLPNVVELENAIYLRYKKYHFYLSHYPTMTANKDYDKPLKARLINLCGHSHISNRWSDWDKGYIYHCELDCHNNYPVSLDQIIEEIKQYDNPLLTPIQPLDIIIPRCGKCVYENLCGKTDINNSCTDPPDGGYYG